MQRMRENIYSAYKYSSGRTTYTEIHRIALVAGTQEKTVERWISRIVPHCEEFMEYKLDKERHNTGLSPGGRVMDFSVGARDRISAEKLFEMTMAMIRGIPLLTTTDGNETYPGTVKKYLKAVSVPRAPENTGGCKDQRGAGCTYHTVSRLLQLHPPAYEPENR